MIKNFIMWFRFLLLPLIIFFLQINQPYFALISFIVALGLHFFHKKRRVESFLAPFSLKTIVGVLLLYFFIKKEFWLLPFIAFIIRDLAAGIIRWRASHDDIFIKRNYLSYVFVTFQSITVLGLIIHRVSQYSLFLITTQFILLFTLCAVVISLLSLGQYIFVYTRKIHQVEKKGRKVEQEKLVILANRKSRGFKDKYRIHLLKIFAKRRNAEIIFLSQKKNLFEGIEDKIKEIDHVIIAGGDGSFEAALNYKPFKNKSLGFFPLGAGNAFYSYFYRGKRFEYLRSRFPFREVKFDVVEVQWDKGKRESMFFGLGIDAEVMRLTSKKSHGFKSYFMAGTKAFFKSRADWDLILDVDGKKFSWNNVINLNFGKISYYGYSIRSLLGKMNSDDYHILGMGCVNTHSPWLNKPLRVWALFLGMWGIPKPPLFPIKGKEFNITSDVPFPIQLGGDFSGYTQELKFKVKRQQKVLVI
ncbi:hypothetical protein COV12_03235 [Candidatus Woesearchaeota archaeon CG10_big_fil_rev_8_21_14_0_10_32_24]|nr:MAG: hypothetical protein COV12_03235 [Candidatus Woesearchaeota archaeon CG10_big_fil_rev_8_21_14_0_10_32_24]